MAPTNNSSTQPPDGAKVLSSALEEICESYLRPQIERIRRRECTPHDKVINDTLWGSIRLYRWEVALLDSYLLQRLRYLRQLGVAHWVYPAAGHTRLEHSLGTLHQMEALLEGLERGSGLAGERVVDDVTTKLLRLAALVHDCGHTLMSHVSEPLVEEIGGMKELTQFLRKKFKARKKVPASEAIAAIFVQSPAFRELLSLPAVGADFIKDVESATEKLAGFILGGPVVPERAFLALLINGAHDADKLDYMPRDCAMAGVPCAVDVRRVIETLRCFDVPASSMTPAYLTWSDQVNQPSVKVLALSSSGARTLGEIAMTRTILYEKIYFHHKVRAIEAMVRRAIAHEAPGTIRDWLSLLDDQLIVKPEPSRHWVDIRSRCLLKRAFVVARPSGSDIGDEAEAGWRRLQDAEGLAAFTSRLRKEAIDVCAAIGVAPDPLKDQPLEVDFPPIGKFELDQYAFVGDSVDGFQVASAVVAGQRSEAGKRAATESGYVFAPEAAVLPVFLATRHILKLEYGLDYGARAYLATRLDPEGIETADKRLRDSGYYNDDRSPADPPVSQARLVSHRAATLESFLKSAWPRIEGLAVRFGPYQAPGASPLSPAVIAGYLRQFGEDSLARPALRMLESVDFRGRPFFSAALKSRLELLASNGGVDVVCPLGSTGDSSAFLSYLMNDVPLELRKPVKALELALEDGDAKSILLWDDFCGAGGHSRTALAQWLGLASGHDLKERLAVRLNDERDRGFRERRVTV